MGTIRGRRYGVGGVVCAAVLAVLVVPGPTAGAEDGTATVEPAGPVITSPVPVAGQTIGGEVRVTVASSAPQVRITWAGTVEDYRDYVDTVGGVAERTLSTSGLHGTTTLLAQECRQQPGQSGGSYTVCDGAQSTVEVDVSNPPPVIDDAQTIWVDEWHGSAGTFIHLVPEGAWAAYGLVVDGGLPWPGPKPGEPWVVFDSEYLSDGAHRMQVVHCGSHEVYGSPLHCDLANPSPAREFTVRRSLSPEILSARRFISPDGNGVGDTARVTVSVDSYQTVMWDLLTEENAIADQSGFVHRAPGPYTFTVDAIDDTGQPLPPGTYTLAVGVLSDPAPGVDPTVIGGRVFTTLTVDLDPPGLSEVSATPLVFYPVVDGFRDRVRFRGVLDEDVHRFALELLRNGQVVRTLPLGPHPQGSFETSWDGRGPHGRLFSAGDYRYRFRLRDRAGNDAVPPGGRITLRWGR
jgi:flagellar hook assembly protein FlgD